MEMALPIPLYGVRLLVAGSLFRQRDEDSLDLRYSCTGKLRNGVSGAISRSRTTTMAMARLTWRSGDHQTVLGMWSHRQIGCCATLTGFFEDKLRNLAFQETVRSPQTLMVTGRLTLRYGGQVTDPGQTGMSSTRRRIAQP